jgi:hypothetical protein
MGFDLDAGVDQADSDFSEEYKLSYTATVVAVAN